MQTIAAFIKKELAQALRDVRMRALIFILPAVQMTLFGYALSTEVRNIRLAVISKPGDRLAAAVERRALASGWFVAAKTEGNDPAEWLSSGRAEAVIIAPEKGFGDSFKRGEGRLQLLVDATNAVRARQIEAYVKSVVGSETGESGSPAIINVRVLYNPSLSSSVFMVPGVMCMILCIVTVMLTAMSIAREKELGTIETIISAPVSNGEILAGKTLPYILLALIDVPIVLGVAVWLFGVPMRGHYWQLFAAALVFVATTVSIGVLISTFAKNQQQAMMGGFLFIFPAILLSGIMFPVENIPAALRVLAYADPLNYFISVLRNIMLKGGSPQALERNLSALAAICALAFFAGAKRFSQKLN